MVTADTTPDLIAPVSMPLPDDGSPLLTAKQHQAIALLADGQSVSAAARALGIHRTTIHYWRRTDPAFALALNDADRDSAHHWRSATQARAEKALTALDEVLDNERTPATVRLKAVLHVLNTATSLPAVVDPIEQDLLTRERQKASRQQNREIDRIMADADALHITSFEESQAMSYEREALDCRCSDSSEPESEDNLSDDEECNDLVENAGGRETEQQPCAPAAIHHNSSLFDESDSCRTAGPLLEPKPVRTSKKSRKQRRRERAGRSLPALASSGR